MRIVLTLTTLLTFTGQLFSGEPEGCAPDPVGQAIQFVAGAEFEKPMAKYDTSVYHLKHVHARAMLKALWRELAKATSDGSPLSVVLIPTSSDDSLVAICPRGHAAVVKKAIEACDVQPLYAVKLQLFEITADGKTVPASKLSLVVGREGALRCKTPDGQTVTVKLNLMDGTCDGKSCGCCQSDSCSCDSCSCGSGSSDSCNCESGRCGSDCACSGCKACAKMKGTPLGSGCTTKCRCCSSHGAGSASCACHSSECSCGSESECPCDGCPGCCGPSADSTAPDEAKTEKSEPYEQSQGFDFDFSGESEQAPAASESGTAKPSQKEDAQSTPFESIKSSQASPPQQSASGPVCGIAILGQPTCQVPTLGRHDIDRPDVLFWRRFPSGPSAYGCDECPPELPVALGQPQPLVIEQELERPGCCCPASHESTADTASDTAQKDDAVPGMEPPAMLSLAPPHRDSLGGIAISPRWQLELSRIYRGRRLSEIFEPVNGRDVSAKALGRLLAEIPKPGHEEHAEPSQLHGVIVVDLPDRVRIFEEVTPSTREASAPTACPVCPDCREEFRSFLEDLLRNTDFSADISRAQHADPELAAPSADALRELPNVTVTKVATSLVNYPLGDLVLLDEHGRPVFDQCTIIDHIQAAVAPESWSQPGISMQFDQQSVSLVIRQTPEVHKLIEAHLRYLHRLHFKQISSMLERLSTGSTVDSPAAN